MGQQEDSLWSHPLSWQRYASSIGSDEHTTCKADRHCVSVRQADPPIRAIGETTMRQELGRG